MSSTPNLIGFIPHEMDVPGFGQAIFEDSAGDLLIQIPDRRHKGYKFIPISSDLDLVYLNVRSAAVDQSIDYIYVFSDKYNHTHAGTKTDLKTILIKALNDLNYPASVCLQIADLIGSPLQRRNLNITLHQEIFQTYGETAARIFYECSVLQDTFWRILSDAVKDSVSSEKIRYLRKKISSNLRLNEQLLPYPLWSELAPQLSISPNAIQRMVISEVPIVPPSVINPKAKEADNESVSRPNAFQSRSRQEQRIASILRSFVQSREVGRMLLQSIKPRAKFERSALRFIERIFEVPHLLDAREDEVALKAASALYRRKSCRRRAYLLLYLAEEFHEFDNIRDFVVKSVSQSKSLEIVQLREKILSFFHKYP